MYTFESINFFINDREWLSILDKMREEVSSNKEITEFFVANMHLLINNKAETAYTVTNKLYSVNVDRLPSISAAVNSFWEEKNPFVEPDMPKTAKPSANLLLGLLRNDPEVQRLQLVFSSLRAIQYALRLKRYYYPDDLIKKTLALSKKKEIGANSLHELFSIGRGDTVHWEIRMKENEKLEKYIQNFQFPLLEVVEEQSPSFSQPFCSTEELFALDSYGIDSAGNPLKESAAKKPYKQDAWNIRLRRISACIEKQEKSPAFWFDIFCLIKQRYETCETIGKKFTLQYKEIYENIQLHEAAMHAAYGEELQSEISSSSLKRKNPEGPESEGKTENKRLKNYSKKNQEAIKFFKTSIEVQKLSYRLAVFRESRYTEYKTKYPDALLLDILSFKESNNLSFDVMEKILPITHSTLSRFARRLKEQSASSSIYD